jgi:hypothetical protein
MNAPLKVRLPCWLWASSRAMASPSPVSERTSRVVKRSKMASCWSGGMPGPSSAMCVVARSAVVAEELVQVDGGRLEREAMVELGEAEQPVDEMAGAAGLEVGDVEQLEVGRLVAVGPEARRSPAAWGSDGLWDDEVDGDVHGGAVDVDGLEPDARLERSARESSGWNRWPAAVSRRGSSASLAVPNARSPSVM